MPIVTIANVGDVEFPDSMDDEQIREAIEYDILKTRARTTRDLDLGGRAAARGAQAVGGVMESLGAIANRAGDHLSRSALFDFEGAETVGQPLADVGAGIYESGQRDIDAINAGLGSRDRLSFLQKGLVGAAESSIPMAVSLATGNPAAATATLGGVTGGTKFSEARREGDSVGTAARRGAIEGAIEAGTEILPFKKFLKGNPVVESTKGATLEVLKNIAKGIGFDIAGEQIATAGQGASDVLYGEKDPNRPGEDLTLETFAKEQLPDQALDTLATSIVMAPLAGTGGQVRVGNRITGSGEAAEPNQEDVVSSLNALNLGALPPEVANDVPALPQSPIAVDSRGNAQVGDFTQAPPQPDADFLPGERDAVAAQAARDRGDGILRALGAVQALPPPGPVQVDAAGNALIGDFTQAQPQAPQSELQPGEREAISAQAARDRAAGLLRQVQEARALPAPGTVPIQMGVTNSLDRIDTPSGIDPDALYRERDAEAARRANAMRMLQTPEQLRDARLTRPDYRGRLEQMAGELVKGGNMALVGGDFSPVNDNVPRGKETPVQRTPSENPGWFKSLTENKDTKVTVEQAKKAVTKALNGERLGVREARVVESMLDEVTGQRSEEADRLREARALRQQAAEAIGITDADVEQAGQLFDEQEYDADWDAETRSLHELATAAADINPEAAQNILESGLDDNAAARRFAEIINDRTTTESAQEVARESGERALAETQDATGTDGATVTPRNRDANPQEVIAPYTAADLAAREQQIRDAEKARKAAEAKADADEQAGNFNLSGSETEADQAAAAGQADLLSQPETKAPAELKNEPENLTPPKPVKTAAPADRIEDFGEKIGGARKDTFAFAEKLADEITDQEILDLPISKLFPKPNYPQFIEEGTDRRALLYVEAMRGTIPAKGRSGYKRRRYVEQVKLVRDLAGRMMSGDLTIEAFESKLHEDESKNLRRVLEKQIDLLDVLGFPAVDAKQLNKASLQHDKGAKRINGELVEGEYWWATGPDGRLLGSWVEREDALNALRGSISKKAERSNKFVIYGKRGAEGYFIGKKVGRGYIDLKSGFKSGRDAQNYLGEHTEEIEKLLEEKKHIAPHRNIKNRERVGPARADQDVTEQMFTDAFGFRGVEFGNYVEQGKRQSDLNRAYDSLFDLADILGIPTQALSLNGSLGLAFGARGHGGKKAAAAHFESDKVVINLTKHAGPGSLAHEWWHALDNYFSRQRGRKTDFITRRPNAGEGVRPEMIERFKDVMTAIGATGLRARSAQLDARRSKDYWSTPVEMSARVFENYVIEKLEQVEQQNDYLANVVREGSYGEPEAYPYLKADELQSVVTAFDRFFETIQTRKSDTGTELYRRGGRDRAPAVDYDLDGLVNAASAEWANGPAIEIVDTVSDLPFNAPSDVEGAYLRGRVFLVRENLPTPERAAQVLLHEAVGHNGLRGLLGDRLDGLLDEVAKAHDLTDVARLNELDLRKPKDRRTAAEEFLAQMAEKGESNTFLDRLRVRLRRWLRRIFPNIAISRAELRAIIAAARGFVQRGERDAGTLDSLYGEITETTGTQPAVASRPGRDRSGPRRDEQGRFSRDSEAGGRGDGRSPEGQRGPLDNPNFRKWFGQSRIQSGGQPVRVYHASRNPINVFNADASKGHASSGLGNFFSRDRATAEGYGDEMFEGYLRIERPYKMPLSEFASFDSVAESAARRRELIAAGHDGIVIRFPRDMIARGEAPPSYIITFFPNQSKSVNNAGTFSREEDDVRFSRGDNSDAVPAKDVRGFPNAVDIYRDKVGEPAWDKLTETVTPILAKLKLADTAPLELKRALRTMRAEIQASTEKAKAVATATAKMPAQERELITDFIEETIATGVVPPQSVVETATMMRAALTDQREQLIELDMLPESVRERWGRQYIARYYTKHLLKSAFDKKFRAANKKIDGAHLRGRGLFERVPKKDVEAWEALGWEPRDPDWELYSLDEKVLMWRDFTPEEREKMGEVRDGVYRFVRGYLESSKDLAMGRLFERMAEHSYTRDSDPGTGDYHQVPTTIIPGTGTDGAFRYGKLAGKWVPQDVWEQLAPIWEPRGDVLNAYFKALSFWKEGKTALNPVVHSNNIISNIPMSHWAGVNIADPRVWKDTAADYLGKGEYYREATEHGLFGTEFYAAEIQATVPELAQIKDLESATASKAEKVLRAIAKNTQIDKVQAAREWMGRTYQAEDQYFKLMVYRDQRQKGAGIEEAIDHAERYIFNYADIPAGVRVAKATGWPFFTYFYKALPAVLHTAVVNPHRFLPWLAIFGGINWLAFQQLFGDDGDEQEETERRLMPEFMKGRTPIGVQKNVRMPWNGEDGEAVYLDISRRMPLGDLFDMNNQLGGLDIPAPLMPNSPVFTLTAGLIMNTDTFTGRDIVESYEQDTWDAVEKRAAYLMRQVMPNNPVLPGSYSFDKIMNGISGSTGTEIEVGPVGFTGQDYAGREQNLTEAIANSVFGFKLRKFDTDQQRQRAIGEQRRIANDIKWSMRSTARAKSLTEKQKARRRDELDEALERVKDNLRQLRE